MTHEKPPTTRAGGGVTPDCREKERSDADCDPLAVECNNIAVGAQVAGKELGALHGTAYRTVQVLTRGAREGNAACPAAGMRFTEEGYSDVAHEIYSLLHLPSTGRQVEDVPPPPS